jgi:uncharacterized coiled-coil protein SlyX
VTLTDRFVAFAKSVLIALAIGWSAPAAAQSTASYKSQLDSLALEMRALWGELERFQPKPRYCHPPYAPMKAPDEATMLQLSARADALNARYIALRQSLNDFLAGNPSLYSQLLIDGVDPRANSWWSWYDSNRKRMMDERARKKAMLDRAPVVNCGQVPAKKPQPMTAGPPQPPPQPPQPPKPPQPPQPPTYEPITMPVLPKFFCSEADKLAFLQSISAQSAKANENAKKAGMYQTDVNFSILALENAGQAVPESLRAHQRRADSELREHQRQFDELHRLHQEAAKIPVIDCTQPQPPKQNIRTGQEPQSEPRQDMRTGQAPSGQPQQPGLDQFDESQIARQQQTIEEVEAGLAELRQMGQRGRCEGMEDLADELAEYLNMLGPRTGTIRIGVIIGPPLPPGQLDKWWDELEAIMEDCPEPLPLDVTAATILTLHNQLRAEVGVPPLTWDQWLATKAAAYAGQLASTGQLAHSSRVGRGTERENLNKGLLGWDTRQMLQNWVNEKKYFVPGLYPNVTTTGRWQDVSHYTQMVWPTTMKLGCGLASGSGFRWLVCYYDPGGNKDGKFVGLNPSMPQPRHVVASTPTMPQPRNGVARQKPPVIANQDGIAPPNSSTRTDLGFDPRTLPRMKVGGGMTQLDPPPPPPPTARDDAPEGKEENHPLVRYFNEAFGRHATAIDCGDRTAKAIESLKMRYAIDELKKRLKAAKAAGEFSAVKPEDVQKQIDDMEQKLRSAEQRVPPGACPPMPQTRGIVAQPNPSR